MSRQFFSRLFIVGILTFVVLAFLFSLVWQPLVSSAPILIGPHRVKDIATGVYTNSYPSPLIPANSRLYFFAYDEYGRNLWVSDGTEAGTMRVKDLDPGSGAVADHPWPTPYTTPAAHEDVPLAVDDDLYFAAGDGRGGESFWYSDGTVTDTVVVKAIYTDTLNYAYPHVADFKELNGNILFRAYEENTGYELWLSDGTESGTILLKDIYEGGLSSYPSWLTKGPGGVYFVAEDTDHGSELWLSDGTEDGTQILADIRSGPAHSGVQYLTVMDGHVYFGATDGSGTELWRTDGTVTGTTSVTGPDSPGYFFIRDLTVVDDKLFFVAYTNAVGSELWVSDGTLTGTVLVKDINLAGGSTPRRMTAVADRLFFYANDGENGYELWLSDGTEEGTHLVKDINPGAACSKYCTFSLSNYHPWERVNLNGIYYFTADDGEHGEELWQSDGTLTGTVMVADINPGPEGSVPNHLAVLNNILFFAADDGNSGVELWTLGNTAPVAEDDVAETVTNAPVAIDVLQNDTDFNLDNLTVISVSVPLHGDVMIEEDGLSVIYAPDVGFTGTDTFTYAIQDDHEATAVASVTILVEEAPITPTSTPSPTVTHTPTPTVIPTISYRVYLPFIGN